MRSPSLVVFLSIARTLRKLERHLSKQNETLEALRSYLIPPVPAPNEEPISFMPMKKRMHETK